MIVQWRKSSYSGGANDTQCVELGRLSAGIGVRDSKDPEGGRLCLTVGGFAELVREIKEQAER